MTIFVLPVWGARWDELVDVATDALLGAFWMWLVLLTVWLVASTVL
ncbi:MAG: hypothetical protein H0U60_08355 [Blastocatellia bacterium]|nr:hypothetical protein [Blastocatellia bacterium]